MAISIPEDGKNGKRGAGRLLDVIPRVDGPYGSTARRAAYARAVYALVEERRGDRKWVVGDRMWIADIHLFWLFRGSALSTATEFTGLTGHNDRMMTRRGPRHVRGGVVDGLRTAYVKVAFQESLLSAIDV